MLDEFRILRGNNRGETLIHDNLRPLRAGAKGDFYNLGEEIPWLAIPLLPLPLIRGKAHGFPI